MASFPIKVYSGNDFQVVENEVQFAVLLKQFTYIRAAGGIVRNPNGQLLMIYRRNVWDFPKGKVEAGETAETAARREVLEETGVSATIINKPPISVFHTYDTYGIPMIKETIWFFMESSDTLPIPQVEEDIDRVIWVNEADVATLLHNSFASLRETWERAKNMLRYCAFSPIGK